MVVLSDARGVVILHSIHNKQQCKILLTVPKAFNFVVKTYEDFIHLLKIIYSIIHTLYIHTLYYTSSHNRAFQKYMTLYKLYKNEE